MIIQKDLVYCPYCMTSLKSCIRCSSCLRDPSAYTAAAHHLPPGTVLKGRYILGGVLGEGGYGITYIGLDLVLQLRVAVKEYFPVEFCTRNSGGSKSVSVMTGIPAKNYKRGMSRYLTEARQLARMDKQRVIVNVRVMLESRDRIGRCDRDNEEGDTLACETFCDSEKPLPEHDSLMGTRRGRVRLLDFGSARSSDSLKDTLTITLRNGYAPSEQYQQGGGQGPWTDVYGLSATLYYCLTGVRPPVATNRIIEDALIPLSGMGARLSPSREEAVMKGLSVRPHRRYRTVKEFWRALYE